MAVELFHLFRYNAAGLQHVINTNNNNKNNDDNLFGAETRYYRYKGAFLLGFLTVLHNAVLEEQLIGL